MGVLLLVLGAVLGGSAAAAPTPAASPTPTPAALPAAGPVSLTGTVTNGTAGSVRPAQANVTGTEVDSGATTVVAVKTGQMAADGTFRVDGLPDKSGDRFFVSTDYSGVTYVAEDHPPAGVTLTVYETTTDDSSISILADTMSVFPGKANIYDALQLMTVRNSSDRTYIGKPDPGNSGLNQALELPVPKGMQSFSANSGISTSGLSVTADGQIASADPVVPGDESISYLYEVPVAKSGWPMSRAVIYPTDKVALLVDPTLRVNGPGLKFIKSVDVSGQKFRDYEGGALSPGTALSADITPASSNSRVLWIILFTVLTLLLIASLVVPRVMRVFREKKEVEEAAARRQALAQDWVGDDTPVKRPAATGAAVAEETDATAGAGPDATAGAGADATAGAGADRLRLIEEIAALDEAHEGGGLSDEQYAADRARLKEQLIGLDPPAGTP